MGSWIIILNIVLLYFLKDGVFAVECGIPKPIQDPFMKIVGGINVTGDFPWFVTFAKVRRNEWMVFCGGALINERHVVTAAHCFMDHRRPGEIIEKRYRAIFQLKSQCGLEGNVEEIRKIYPHEKYIPDTANPEADIAVVAMERSVPYTPICLPTRDYYAHMLALIIGFGAVVPRNQNSNSLSTNPRQLGNPAFYPCFEKQASIVIYTAEECRVTGYGDVVPPKTICAGRPKGGVDACDGDSGGPLMVELDGRLELVGITSYGSGCARKDFPGIYSDVTSRGYLSWILDRVDLDRALLVAPEPVPADAQGPTQGQGSRPKPGHIPRPGGLLPFPGGPIGTPGGQFPFPGNPFPIPEVPIPFPGDFPPFPGGTMPFPGWPFTDRPSRPKPFPSFPTLFPSELPYPIGSMMPYKRPPFSSSFAISTVSSRPKNPLSSKNCPYNLFVRAKKTEDKVKRRNLQSPK